MRKLLPALAFVTLASTATALGQSYPARYVTIIVPFTAGSPVDTISRILAPGMSKLLAPSPQMGRGSPTELVAPLCLKLTDAPS